jgi:hypothetical protein
MALENLNALMRSLPDLGATIMSEEINSLDQNKEFLLQKDIFPIRQFRNEKELLAFIKFLPQGIMSAWTGGAPNLVNLDAGYILKYFVGEWRDMVHIDEIELRNAYDPQDPGNLLGFTKLSSQALEILNTRLENLIEYLCMRLAIYGNFTYKGTTVSANIPDDLRMSIDLTAGLTNYKLPIGGTYPIADNYQWTPGGVWSNWASADIVGDISNYELLLNRIYGTGIEALYIPPYTMRDVRQNEKLLNLMKGTTPQALGDPNISFGILNMPPIKPYNASILYRTTVTTAAAQAATSLIVEDYTPFSDNDAIRITTKAGKSFSGGINAAVTTTTLTVEPLEVAVEAGSVVEISKPVIPEKYIIGKTKKINSQFTAVLPSTMTENIRSEKYAKSASSPVDTQIWLEVVAGMNGVPVVVLPGGFFAMYVG